MAASTSAACHGQMNASDDSGQSGMNESARQSWLDVDDPENCPVPLNQKRSFVVISGTYIMHYGQPSSSNYLRKLHRCYWQTNKDKTRI